MAETAEIEKKLIEERDLARELAKEISDKLTKTEAAFHALQKCFVGDVVCDGWLSPTTRAFLRFHGPIGWRELDALIQKLQVDAETAKDHEFMKPIEDRA